MKPLILSNKENDVLDAPGGREEDDAQLKRTLLKRIGWTFLLIIVLLGALAWFEAHQSQPSGQRAPKTSPAEDQAARREIVQSIQQTAAPVEAPPAPPAEKAEAIEPNVDRAPPRDETQQETMTPKAAGKAAPREADRREIVPLAQPALVERKTSPPERPGSGKQLHLQVGVFAEHANAEALQKKLREAGIPAHIEARVMVGPFASRTEARAAQAKLKKLGITTALPVRR
jgi:cell division septation protein DedD